MLFGLNIEDVFWKTGIALTLVLCLRLLTLHLFAEYKALGVFLAFSSARSIALMVLTLDSPYYADLYVYSIVPFWMFAGLVALEIYSKVLEGYRGLSIFTRRTMISVLLVSAVGALVLVGLSLGPEADQFPRLRFFLGVEQAMALTLFLFLLLLAGFLLWYPIPLRKNLILYSFGYSTVLFTVAAAVALRNLGGHAWTRYTSTAMLGIYALCILIWALSISVQGESEVRTAAIPRGEGEEQRLLAQLSAMNALIESGRKG